MPKLRIRKPFGQEEGEVCDLETARRYFSAENGAFLVMVDGHLVRSYEELVKLAEQDAYRDKESIEVSLLAMVAGG
ncbi:MAG: MoaD/ThiS family protein [Chloroflexi bacterium]|nr:MoaD/ThiS family protein [Chloroflexota bacterium]